ncbi:hypothetical protein [Nocardia sp. NPDC051832]|uniref:SMP-30/gluconolactonase/LRE family protein n=1 Tax=Nocardia sp. NPDC051832 TaxID=3155673 RepID=UPI003424AAB8
MNASDKVGTALAAAAFAVLATATAPGASAAPVCPGGGQPAVQVASIPGTALEGLTVDPLGRAYTTDLFSGRVFRIDAPGAPAVPIATVPSGGGGALAWSPDGALLVGYGADPRVFAGDALRHAGIARLDPGTGAMSPFAAGLSAANGMDVASDGIVYATNDFASLIGRVYPGGAVQADWGNLPSANGAVLSSDDEFLYVSRTFVNPGVSRIPVRRPDAPQSLIDLPGAAPDGLTLDSLDRPVVPLNTSGQIIRLDGPGQSCLLGTSGPTTSVVSYGRGGGGFAAGRLFAATFTGAIFEIPGGFDPDARTATPG